MKDYKYAAQLLAEELAEAEFGCEFYDLDTGTQCRLYERGMQMYVDKQMDAAEAREDR